MYTLAIDTGKHLAAALLSPDGTLRAMYYQHETCFQKSDVEELGRRLVHELLAESDATPDRLEIVIEVPSHRYFGRGNASAVLKAMWQGMRLFLFFQGRVRKVALMPADKWNKQRNDKQKRRLFNHTFPDYKKIDYYQEKHGGRSNAHERDAALLAKFWYDTQKLSRRADGRGTLPEFGDSK